MLKNTLFLVVYLLLTPAWALQFADRYVGGDEACQENRFSKKEQSFRVSVPVDYSDTKKGFTTIYAWTHKEFDPSKRSLVFFTGGPGSVAHGIELELPQWNLIFFDTRGNSCSRPESEKVYFDPAYYNSEWVARDVEALRKQMGIDKLTVYGISYGTVPAHLYGHLFPQQTRSVVLEGVVYEGGSKLTEPANRIVNLQKFFDSLPIEQQNKILRLSSHPELTPFWFSQIGMLMLYSDNPYKGFEYFLNTILEDEDAAVAMIKSFKDKEPFDDAFGFGQMFMAMIGCQELGMAEQGPSFFSVFEGRTLRPSGYSHLKEHYCDSISGFKVKNYNASQKPSKAKTFYVQGFLDGATGYMHAIQHFHLATRDGQLLLAKNGGHLPLHNGLNSGYEAKDVAAAKLKILEKLFSGEQIQMSDLEELEAKHPLGWSLLNKN